MVILLLKVFGSEKHLLNNSKQNVLFSAVEAGKREIVALLMKDGFKLIKDDRGMNPLHVAVLASDLEMAKQLLNVHNHDFYIKQDEFAEQLVN